MIMKVFFRVLKYIFVGLLFVLSYSAFILCNWSVKTFNVSLESILFTISSPLKGTEVGVVEQAIQYCLPKVFVLVAVYILHVVIDCTTKFSLLIKIKFLKKEIGFDLIKLQHCGVILLSVLSVVFSFLYVNENYDIVNYLYQKNNASTIYEDYYVDPKDLTFSLKSKDGKYKNLLFIFLESMETAYTSVDNGGAQDICYIPELVNIAKENVSFSDSELLGGFNVVDGSSYTMGALLASTSGVPFSFPIDYNSMEERTVFAGGLVGLGDILDDLGYFQEFLCGSDADFAGRKNYFVQHGNYEIFDLYTAREEGYVKDDYFAWWGIEDKYLYDIAKAELLGLSNQSQPFNLTMLTVDTHHISGYLCSECEDLYETKLENVVSCADRQIGEFLEWCKQQDFYDDTVIVLVGDHPRMDSDLVAGIESVDRTMYNCFINSSVSAKGDLKNRSFTSMDIFPTTLAALGIDWGGDRLGLGTNMFSQSKTLSEVLGFTYFNDELSKKSNYYVKKFS